MDFYIFVSEKMSINPWQVDNIQEFYFLKCPECDFVHKEESDFQNHAVENHPLSVVLFGDLPNIKMEEITIIDDFNEENESSNTVNEELPKTENDTEDIEIDLELDSINDQRTLNNICHETNEFQDSEISQASEIEISDALEVPEVPEIPEVPDLLEVPIVLKEPQTIPLLTHEYAASEIANAISNESLLLNNELHHKAPLPLIKDVVGENSSQNILTMPSSSNLISQKLINIGAKNYKCSCCGASFARISNLKNHVKVIHEGKKVNKCSICDSSFTHSANLKRHIATVHDGQKPFKCLICDVCFGSSGNLKTHVASVHERQKPFKCLTCDASFTQRGSLKTHIETIHEEQKLFKCEICDAGFTQMLKLKGHVATVHEGQKPVKCLICDASFSQRESMNKHFLSFHKNQIRSVKDIR